MRVLFVMLWAAVTVSCQTIDCPPPNCSPGSLRITDKYGCEYCIGSITDSENPCKGIQCPDRMECVRCSKGKSNCVTCKCVEWACAGGSFELDNFGCTVCKPLIT